jgi:hypothetical protein
MASSAPLTLARWLCPLYSRKLPRRSLTGMTAKGQQRTSGVFGEIERALVERN